MTFTKDTKVTQILNTYPWLVDELIKYNAQFKKLKSPIVRAVISKATLEDACNYIKVDFDTLVGELNGIIEKHNNG